MSVSVRCPLHPETFENNAWQAWILAKICFARYVFWLLRYFRLLLMILSYTVVCNLVMKHWSRGKDKYNCIQVKRKVSFDKLWQPGEGSLCKRTDTSWIFCKKFLLSQKKIPVPVRLSVDSLCNGMKFRAVLHNLFKMCRFAQFVCLEDRHTAIKSVVSETTWIAFKHSN